MTQHHGTSTRLLPLSIPSSFDEGKGAGLMGGATPFTDRPSKATRRLRALVVDDAPDVTELLGMILRHSGYDVVTAFSAPDALEAARGGRFDIVVSDVGMPGMNGYELAEALRQLPDYEAVPMIAVTGFSMYDDRDRALAAGFNAFLTKPVNPLDLMELVERLQG